MEVYQCLDPSAIKLNIYNRDDLVQWLSMQITGMHCVNISMVFIGYTNPSEFYDLYIFFRWHMYVNKLDKSFTH